MLKHKTRIPVEKGYHLHGIMDETDTIEEGQIFCTVRDNGVNKVIVGKRLIISRVRLIFSYLSNHSTAACPPPSTAWSLRMIELSNSNSTCRPQHCIPETSRYVKFSEHSFLLQMSQ
jgi:RNA dependent RNA polymerase